MVVAGLLPAMGSLTVTNLLGNHLDAESAKMLSEVAKQKGISLCGIHRDQTTAVFTAVFFYRGLGPPEAILLASDLLQASVTGALTSLNLSSNQLCGIWTDWNGEHGTFTTEGITAIADALRVNGVLTSLNLGDNQLCGLDGYGRGTYTADGITAIADALRVNGALTALYLSSNYLKDEGVSAVCKAIQSDKKTKLASLNFGNNGIGPVGANAVAVMVVVTGSLTSLDLSKNRLGAEGAAALAPALAANGSLTSLNLGHNQLCGLDEYGRGTYTADGITAIADALRVNGALTQVLATRDSDAP